jgi:hypothetical protein
VAHYLRFRDLSPELKHSFVPGGWLVLAADMISRVYWAGLRIDWRRAAASNSVSQ